MTNSLGLSRIFSNASLPTNNLPLFISITGHGVLANAIALNISALPHITDIPDTCSPIPPICCGVPNNLASLRLLHSSSCDIPPKLKPNKLTWMPPVFGIKQLSCPPPPMIVGDMAEGGGCEPGLDPAPLYVLLSETLLLLLSTIASLILVLRSPVTSCPNPVLGKPKQIDIAATDIAT